MPKGQELEYDNAGDAKEKRQLVNQFYLKYIQLFLVTNLYTHNNYSLPLFKDVAKGVNDAAP
jgi:hypothetical protein